jgi:hypothetical protein
MEDGAHAAGSDIGGDDALHSAPVVSGFGSGDCKVNMFKMHGPDTIVLIVMGFNFLLLCYKMKMQAALRVILILIF